MTETSPLHSELMSVFEQLTPRLQMGARFILDHPKDVALLSMRELSKRPAAAGWTISRRLAGTTFSSS